MSSVRWGVLIAVVACRPTLTPPNNDDDVPIVTPPRDTWATTGDTGAPPPCATPEIEPNDVGSEATALPFEHEGCGALSVGDRDTFTFTLDDPGWLAVEVERGSGSPADLKLDLDGPGGLRVEKLDDTESTDAKLKFPAPSGDYLAIVSEQSDRGGDRFTYEVLVSEAKAPVEWTALEVEPNDTSAQAQLVAGSEVSIFGVLDGNDELPDRDWYEIQIPGGEHALHIDVDAFTYGAAGDVQVEVRDIDDVRLQQLLDQVVGGTRYLDPKGTYRSDGDETVRLQVQEKEGVDGPAQWYVLRLRLVAQ